ncbi:copper/zinc-superoxide dismutase [Fulvivirga imtechensis AK7]|uniref:Copper/zinc-superoxide dismutase n=1 Tax=Fulvivirga imtechensis AK7 TaxID=1237149 RepID=L8K031_9BACT|nr:superoxide dismutase family protein [Fulvivirga imtechensis]ELR73289.1 copper/zinc-superoxide dismutase [Fulvivirga imtechensis AK7]
MKLFRTYLMALCFAMLFACGAGNEDKRDTMEDAEHFEPINGDVVENDDENSEASLTAIANIASASGSKLTGKATFRQQEDGKVKFELEVKNAKPGQHAVHLHENGDCSAADASSAGGHWNPTNTKHGKRGEGEFHKGDIGNMEVGNDGNGSMEMTVEGWSIGGAKDSNILNKAVIVHAGADDFTSQPSGAAGAMIGCGVIKQGVE